MNTITQQNKKIWIVGATTAVVAVLFSFFGAPFLRAFFAKTRPLIYWGLGAAVITTLFLLHLTPRAVYVGAIWMTLGLYSELEKRGVSWRKTSVISVMAGFVFAAVAATVILKTAFAAELLTQATEPLIQSLSRFYPETVFTAEQVFLFLPGLLLSALVSAVAIGLSLESRIFELFTLKREKTASALRWLEFRLPDAFIWIALMSFFLSMVGVEAFVGEAAAQNVRTVAINGTIVSLVLFFIQGLVVIEFISRVYRWGAFARTMLYLTIFLWAHPVVVLIGLMDYWVDLRGRIRKKIK
jgi:Predicted membrane protein (DUF2232)